MKSILLLVAVALAATANAQSKPFILNGPTGWQFEQFPLPPGFAPTVKYKGLEELRFSPGMFKKDAPDYFTYAFAARFDDTKRVSQADIREYLVTYFRGLCSKTAADRKLPPIDTSAITASIVKDKDVYDVTLHAFGVFADGAPVTLHMEVEEIVKANAVYLLFIVSPLPKTNAVWQELYKIRAEALKTAASL